jgi:hypothetical protein
MAQPRDDGALACARKAVGEDVWASELAVGAAMSLEEAVAYALEETVE